MTVRCYECGAPEAYWNRENAASDSQTAEIERLRAALKEVQAYSVGDPRPRHTWYYDRAEQALNQQFQKSPETGSSVTNAKTE